MASVLLREEGVHARDGERVLARSGVYSRPFLIASFRVTAAALRWRVLIATGTARRWDFHRRRGQLS
jgi:hypothetical protein